MLSAGHASHGRRWAAWRGRRVREPTSALFPLGESLSSRIDLLFLRPSASARYRVASRSLSVFNSGSLCVFSR